MHHVLAARSRTSSRATARCAATTSSARAAGTATGCRSRSPSSSSSASLQGRDRGYGIAEFNARCRESVVRVPRGLERADRADRLLARPRRRVPHARPDLRRVGLVGAEADRRPGAALRGPQGRAVLPALRHGAVRARGRARLRGRRGPVRLRALQVAAGRRAAAGRRRAARVDDDAVDARLQRGGRRRPRADLRAREDGHARRAGRARRGARRARARRRDVQILERFPGAALDGVRYEPPFQYIAGVPSTASAGTRSCSPTSSRPTTAPASCTRRSRSARTTSASARSTASTSSTRSGSTAPTTSASAATPGASSRTPTPT